MALKNLDDGRKIKAYIKKYDVKKVVIIGTGYIGLEMCEALRSLSIKVDMVSVVETVAIKSPVPVFIIAAELLKSIPKRKKSCH